MVVLDVRGLKKTYTMRNGFLWKKKSTVEAVKDVTFSVRKNETFGLLGPNGAGKSTTVNILAGIVIKDAGSINVFGGPCSQRKKYRMNGARAYNLLLHYLTVP